MRNCENKYVGEMSLLSNKQSASETFILFDKSRGLFLYYYQEGGQNARGGCYPSSLGKAFHTFQSKTQDAMER